MDNILALINMKDVYYLLEMKYKHINTDVHIYSILSSDVLHIAPTSSHYIHVYRNSWTTSLAYI